MANQRGRHENFGGRNDEGQRRGRQQGSDYGRNWQNERGGSRQHQAERFSGDFRQDERSYRGQAGGWSDDDFGSRQGGFGGEGSRSDYDQSGRHDYGQSGRYEDRFGYGGRDYGDMNRGDDWSNRGSYAQQGNYGDWQDRGNWQNFQDRGGWQNRSNWQGRGGYDDRFGYGMGGGYYGGRTYGGRERGYSQGGRDFWDKASDEVSSWFGDEQAEHRRDMDRHRGRGPRSYARSDDRIKEDVNDRLTDDGFIDASDIEVSVSNREVTLAGHVDGRYEKRRAEDLAEGVSGVTHVQNNLRVQQGDTTGSSYGGTSTGTTATSSTARKTSKM